MVTDQEGSFSTPELPGSELGDQMPLPSFVDPPEYSSGANAIEAMHGQEAIPYSQTSISTDCSYNGFQTMPFPRSSAGTHGFEDHNSVGGNAMTPTTSLPFNDFPVDCTFGSAGDADLGTSQLTRRTDGFGCVDPWELCAGSGQYYQEVFPQGPYYRYV